MVTRISGLASGMDIDSMVKGMLQADRVKVDKVSQNKQKLEWKQQLYNDINKEFAEFIVNAKKEFGLMTGKLSGIGWHKEATSDNEDAVTAKVSGINSFSGTHTVDVISMAEGVDVKSSSALNMKDWTVGENGSFKFAINGKNIEVADTDNLSSIARKINSSGAGVMASYDSTLDRFFLQTSTVGSNAKVEISGEKNADGSFTKLSDKASTFFGSLNLGLASTELKQGVYENTKEWKVESEDGIKIGIGSKTISLAKGEGISDIVSKINSAQIPGLSAAYDSETKKLYIKGTADQISSINDKLSVADAISGYSAPSENMDVVGTITLGKVGSVKYNNLDPEPISSNTFTFNGVTFTAKAKGAATVTITPNIDTAIEKITKFVDEYNKMLDKAGGIIGEKANRNYQPLTGEQKEAMTEKEVELWEERAKKGLLNRDSSITNMLSTARSGLYQNVKGYNATSKEYTENITGSFSHITEIGITTQEYASGTVGGKLKIDETKLREALAADADSVLTMLFKEPSTDYSAKLTGLEGDEKTRKEAEIKRSESGIFTRLVDDMSVGMKEIISKSGPGESSQLFRDVKFNLLIEFATGKQGGVSTIQKQMNDMTKQIDDLNVWLFNRENTYYSRFTAMEKAMQNANNQSSWLMQQMGS